jgi:hypothetical protein
MSTDVADCLGDVQHHFLEEIMILLYDLELFGYNKLSGIQLRHHLFVFRFPEHFLLLKHFRVSVLRACGRYKCEKLAPQGPIEFRRARWFRAEIDVRARWFRAEIDNCSGACTCNSLTSLKNTQLAGGLHK